MSEQQPVLPGGPFQHRRFGGASEASILDADQVKIGVAAHKRANEIVVEILVSGQPQPGSGRAVGAAAEQALADAGRVVADLGGVLDRGGLLAALGEVGLDFIAAAQVVAND